MSDKNNFHKTATESNKENCISVLDKTYLKVGDKYIHKSILVKNLEEKIKQKSEEWADYINFIVGLFILSVAFSFVEEAFNKKLDVIFYNLLILSFAIFFIVTTPIFPKEILISRKLVSMKNCNLNDEEKDLIKIAKFIICLDQKYFANLKSFYGARIFISAWFSAFFLNFIQLLNLQIEKAENIFSEIFLFIIFIICYFIIGKMIKYLYNILNFIRSFFLHISISIIILIIYVISQIYFQSLAPIFITILLLGIGIVYTSYKEPCRNIGTLLQELENILREYFIK